jgi:hypothetical protein
MRRNKFTPNLIYKIWRKEVILENGAYGAE